MPEGSIVRIITRLDETCREVRDAARVIGDADLFTKMEAAQALIKRDSESWNKLRCAIELTPQSCLRQACICKHIQGGLVKEHALSLH